MASFRTTAMPRAVPAYTAPSGPSRQREHLLVRQTLYWFSLPAPPVKQSSIQGSDPQICLVSSKRGHVYVPQTGMEFREIRPVEYEQPRLARYRRGLVPTDNPSTAVTFRHFASAGRRWRNRLPSKASIPSPAVPIHNSGSAASDVTAADIPVRGAGGNSAPTRYSAPSVNNPAGPAAYSRFLNTTPAWNWAGALICSTPVATGCKSFKVNGKRPAATTSRSATATARDARQIAKQTQTAATRHTATTPTRTRGLSRDTAAH